jgi:hypothetical protein
MSAANEDTVEPLVRRAVLVELNPEYAKLAQDRCGLFCSPNARLDRQEESR